MQNTLRKVMAFIMVCVMLLATAGAALAEPAAPTGLKQKSVTKNSVAFAWSKVKSAAKYEIYRTAGVDGEFALIATVKTAKYTDKKLPAGTQYTYYVCALDKSGERSEPSGKITLTTKGAASASGSNATNALLDAEYEKIVDKSKIVAGYDELYLNLLNVERVNAGAKPLTVSTELMKTAAVKAADMYNNNYFDYSHGSPTYGELQVFAKKFTGHEIGENVMDADANWTMDFANAALMANTKFMNSPTHRANRLTAGYKTVGFCIYQGPGRIIVVEHFYF